MKNINVDSLLFISLKRSEVELLNYLFSTYQEFRKRIEYGKLVVIIHYSPLSLVQETVEVQKRLIGRSISSICLTETIKPKQIRVINSSCLGLVHQVVDRMKISMYHPRIRFSSILGSIWWIMPIRNLASTQILLIDFCRRIASNSELKKKHFWFGFFYMS